MPFCAHSGDRRALGVFTSMGYPTRSHPMNQPPVPYDAVLPWLSDRGRRLLHSVVDSIGRIPCAQDFAVTVQLVSRHQVARLLRTEGLPQIEELCAWVKTIHLIQEWERTHRSLMPWRWTRRCTRQTAIVWSKELQVTPGHTRAPTGHR